MFRFLGSLVIAMVVPAIGFADVMVTTTATPVTPIAGMANPASVFCKDLGGESITKKDAKGGEYALCNLPDGRSVEEWKLFRESGFEIKTISKNAIAEVDAKYPSYQSKNLTPANKRIEHFIKTGITEVEDNAKDIAGISSAKLSYDSSFASYKSAKTISTVIHAYEFTGGAHGININQTYIYSDTGRHLTFRRYLLGKQDTLNEFAFRAQTALLAKYPNLGKKAVIDATDSKWKNYQNVVIDGDEAIIFFPEYIIGTHVDGEQSVRVSLKGIATYEGTRK